MNFHKKSKRYKNNGIKKGSRKFKNVIRITGNDWKQNELLII